MHGSEILSTATLKDHVSTGHLKLNMISPKSALFAQIVLQADEDRWSTSNPSEYTRLKFTMEGKNESEYCSKRSVERLMLFADRQ